MVDVLARVIADFAPVRDEVEAVYLYGSHARGAAHAGSDVDVCVVAGPGRDPVRALQAVYARARLGSLPYDVRVFEDMPDWLRGQVLDGGVLAWARDVPRLSEYLRPYRKTWEGQRHRNVPTEDDVRRMLDARRRSSA